MDDLQVNKLMSFTEEELTHFSGSDAINERLLKATYWKRLWWIWSG